MIDKYELIFKDLKEYVESNSQYNVRVVKNNTNTSSYFPIVVCQLSNITDTEFCTIDKIDNHREMYLTNDVYTKDKTINNEKIASQVINDEITKLIIKYFENINMRMTMCQMTPNLDTGILRRTIHHQGLTSLTRNIMVRR